MSNKRIYDDEHLNALANSMTDEIDELGQALGRHMGHYTGIGDHRYHYVMDKLSSPLSYCNEILDRNLDRLSQIEKKVGPNDPHIPELCWGVAYAVTNIVKERIQGYHVLTSLPDFTATDPNVNAADISKDLSSSASILQRMNEMRLDDETKSNIRNLQNAIVRIEKKINPSSGCYIATHVYGSYDSPEVIELRLFRDKYMRRTYIGRLFVRLYYTVSPFMVSRFGEYHSFNCIARRALRNLLFIWRTR